jgi:DNA-binding transcriptional LysR family regulator
MAQPAVQVRYLLLDRLVNLIDEGVDVALRIAHLPDSGLIARRVGEVRRVICASPRYLANKKAIMEPSDLSEHDCIAVEGQGQGNVWSFRSKGEGAPLQNVRIKPRLIVNAVEPAVNAAIDGEGVIRVLSYQIEREVHEGELVILLREDEPAPLPVQLVVPEGRLLVAKVRSFVDFSAKQLKAKLARISGI